MMCVCVCVRARVCTHVDPPPPHEETPGNPESRDGTSASRASTERALPLGESECGRETERARERGTEERTKEGKKGTQEKKKKDHTNEGKKGRKQIEKHYGKLKSRLKTSSEKLELKKNSYGHDLKHIFL